MAAVEARHGGAVAVQDRELPARARLDDVKGVVAVDVVEARGDLAARAGDELRCVAAGADRARPSREVAVVGVRENRLAVTADIGRVALLMNGEAQWNRVALWIGIRVRVRRPSSAPGRTTRVVCDRPVAGLGEA